MVNKHFLKIPLSFNYYYDSNASHFECKNTNSLRWVLMNNYTASHGDITENGVEFDSINLNSHYYYNYEKSDGTWFDISTKKNSHDTIYLTEGKPFIYSSELLLIVPRDDEPSIQAVYDLFNQKKPDINTIPTVKVDNKYYIVPFIDLSFVSHFRIGNYHNDTNVFDNVHEQQSPEGFTTNLNLNNVWDRLHLIYHASFAETRHRIIGRNGDHWDTPNKMFIVPSGDQDQFYIRFTTDGYHDILPIGCHFNVDLTFMLNPTKNTATGINQGYHDKFTD